MSCLVGGISSHTNTSLHQVKLLLARKADITARDEDDNTAIHHACTARGPASQCLRSAHTCTAAKTRNAHLGNTDILRMLLEAGAAFNVRCR